LILRRYTVLPDGTIVPITPLPPPCIVCGEVPEATVEVVEMMVGTRRSHP
jgi:hypothetical protein